MDRAREEKEEEFQARGMDQLIECSPQAQEVGILFDHRFTNADTEAQRGQATCWRSSSFQASEPGMMISIYGLRA